MIRLGILDIRFCVQRYAKLSSISIQVLTDVKLNENEPSSVLFFLRTLRIDDHLNLRHDNFIITLLAMRTDVLRIAELEALAVGAERVVGSVKSKKASWLMKVSNVSPFDIFSFCFYAKKKPLFQKWAVRKIKRDHRSDFMIIKWVQDSKEGFYPNLDSLNRGYINMTQRRFIHSKPESRKSINRKIIDLLEKKIWPFSNYEISRLIKDYVKNQQHIIASQFKERGHYDKDMINALSSYAKELPFVLMAIQKVKNNSRSKTAGVDSVIFKKDEEALRLAGIINYRFLKSYKCQAISRVFIPKPNGEM